MSVTTVRQHRYKCRHKYKTQVDSVVSDTNGLLISNFSWWLHEEKDTILQSLCWLYNADPTNVRRILWCLRSLSAEIRKLDLSTVKIQLSPQWQKINSLPPWSNLNFSTDSFSKSSNSQDHLFQAWRHPHSSSISCLGVYYDHGDCHILCTWA